METASTKVTLIRRRNGIEKSTCRTHRYFIDFESRNYVEISTLNRCHNFHMDLSFNIHEISANCPYGILTSNWWWIDIDVSIGMYLSWNIKSVSVLKWFLKMFHDIFNRVGDTKTCISEWFSIDYFPFWKKPQIFFQTFVKIWTIISLEWSSVMTK